MDERFADRVLQLYESAWRERGRWESALAEALDLLQACLQQDPDCVAALTSLGAVLSDLGRHQEALVVLRRAQSLGSTDANMYYNLATALANIDASGRRRAPRLFAKAATLERGATIRAYFDPHGAS